MVYYLVSCSGRCLNFGFLIYCHGSLLMTGHEHGGDAGYVVGVRPRGAVLEVLAIAATVGSKVPR